MCIYVDWRFVFYSLLFAVFQNLKLYFFVEDYTVVGLLVLPFILQNCVRDLMTVDYADVPQPKKVDDLEVEKNKVSPVLASKMLVVFSPVSN